MKKISIFISSLFSYLYLAIPAFAQSAQTAPSAQTGTSINPCDPAKVGTGIAKTLCELSGPNIGNTIKNVIVFFIILGVIFALMYLLYGGIKWITSKGEKTEVEAARNHIVAALVGLVVIFLAVFLVSIVLAAFGINFNQLQIPVISSGGTVPSQ